jgi:hypothetical protein
MPTLTAQTTFQIQESAEVFEETADLILLPENVGSNARRELRYPNISPTLAPIIYDQNPEWWENFDTGPLTGRSILTAEKTLSDVVTARWPGYIKDRPVVERWKGDETKSFMTLNMLRSLWEYVANPPSSGYIEWWPKDRTTKGYYIEIESLTVGGSDGISLNYYACNNGIVMQEVIFTFRIIEEIPA